MEQCEYYTEKNEQILAFTYNCTKSKTYLIRANIRTHKFSHRNCFCAKLGEFKSVRKLVRKGIKCSNGTGHLSEEQNVNNSRRNR